jgi:hypothetical protein
MNLLVALLTEFADDVQDGFGVSHLAYLTTLVIRSPAPLRRVRGFPALRLLRGLRRHRTRVPQAIPRSVDTERHECDLGAPFIPLNELVTHRSSGGGYRARKA